MIRTESHSIYDSRFTIYDLLPFRHFLRLSARVPLEQPRRREFSKLVSDHVLGHEHRNVPFAVMNAEGQTDHIRRDRRTARPGLDRWRLFPAFFYSPKRLLDAKVYERPFL